MSMINGIPDFSSLWSRFEVLPTGPRAELRRAQTPDDLSIVPAVCRLFPGAEVDARHYRIAFLLPHATHRANGERDATLGAQLCHAGVSEQRLMQCSRSGSPTDLVLLRQVMVQAEPRVNWPQFACSLWWWGPKEKRRLIEDYYKAQFADKRDPITND